MSTPLLDIRSLVVSYGRVEAVHGVTLSVEPGSIVTVIGANGAGKTTLLNAAMGVLPAQGEIRFAGESLASWGIEDRVAMGLSLFRNGASCSAP